MELIRGSKHRQSDLARAQRSVDPETGAIVGVTVQDADEAGTTTSFATLLMTLDSN